MSTISAGTSSGTALVSTGDTTGNLVLQTNGTTTALTLNTAQALGVGSSPSFGTSGQVLTSAGSAAAPTWATPASGLTLLSTITAADAATVDIETTFNSTYDTYMIVASGVTFNSATALACRMRIGGTYLTTGTYYWHTNVSKSSASTYEGAAGASSNTIRLSDFGTGAAPTVSNFVIMVYVPASTTLYKTITWQGMSNRADRAETGSGVGRNDDTGALTGIRLYGFNGSSLVSGKFRLYGIAN